MQRREVQSFLQMVACELVDSLPLSEVQQTEVQKVTDDGEVQISSIVVEGDLLYAVVMFSCSVVFPDSGIGGENRNRVACFVRKSLREPN